MQLHQILTGSCNINDQCLSFGSVLSEIFISYGSGSDLVILNHEFMRQQIIPGCNNENSQIVSVSCTFVSGKILVLCFNNVCIYEPYCENIDNTKINLNMFFWEIKSTLDIPVQDVKDICWIPSIPDTIILVGKYVQVWKKEKESFYIDNSKDKNKWCCLWNKLSPSKTTIDRIKFSSDGKYFATLCINSNDLYIWFWDQYSNAYFNENVEKTTNDLFDYITIKHPAFIFSFEWRKISNYAPKNSIINSLLTCSADNVCRIWSETHLNQCQKNSNFNGVLNGNLNDTKIPDYFKNIFSNYIKQKRFDISKELLDISNIDHSFTFKDTHYIYTYPEFVLSASINDITDVPLFTTLNSEKSSATKQPFIIHWLNNKDYNFNYQTENFFNYLLSSLNYKNSEQLINNNLGEFSRHLLLSINKWRSSCDVLFSIHPQNGSLLAWFIHNLDESGSCFREKNSIIFDKSIHIKNSQVTVHSCLPNCIPAADASSMNTNIILYCDEIPIKSFNENIYEIINEYPISYNVKMISKQQNGSLNMWSLAVSNEQNGNTSFLNIKHLSRISGHRWQTNSAACHIQLPFLLTISNSSNGQDINSESSELILWRIKSIGPFSKCGGITEIARINSNNYLNFVLTAWLPGIIPTYLFSIDMSSPASIFIASDFQNKLFLYITIADAKILLEKYASQNEKKSQYDEQAQHKYNIVSITSTGEPGCILSAGSLEDYSEESSDSIEQKTETLFLHVFPRDMIFNDFNCSIENELLDAKFQTKSKTKYCETFFVVRIIRKECLLEAHNESLLEMWKVQLIDNDNNVDLKTLDNLVKFHIIKEKVYSKILKIPKNVAIIKAVPAASHLSSASIYPSCLAPYLISTMCSDGLIRFWRCSTKKINSNYKFKWLEWTMPLQDQFSSKIVFKKDNIPLEVSCAYNGRIAVAYTDNASAFQQPFINININIYECESTGGSEWILEDTIQFFNVHWPIKYKNSSENTSHESQNHSQFSSENESISKSKSYKDLIQVDWVNSEDGMYLLSIAIGTNIMIFTPSCSESCKYSRFINEKSSLAKSIHWMKIDEIPLKTADSMVPLPVHISWTREGLLVVGFDNEVHIYNQWNSYINKYESSKNLFTEEMYDDHKNVNEIIKVTPKANYSLARLRDAYLFNSSFKRSLSQAHIKSIDVENDSEFSDEILQNTGLFEAAQIHNPVLPQYHPKQLMEWINFGKIKRVKAILSHLTTCISNDNSYYKNNRKSVENEVDRPKNDNFDESLYEMGQLEIKAIPPLPLYMLLEIDSKIDTKTSEKSNSLFFSETDLTEQDESINLKLSVESESKNVPWVVCNINEFSNFSPEEAQRLSNCLTRVQLPGLSALDQIYLLGIAELMCNLKSEISDQMNFSLMKDQKELNSNSTNSMDECGLRFLLAMQHFSYMTRTLPINQRNNLMIQGIDTSCLIWGFHSETEEELCVRLDEITLHNITWVDFRRYGCGWWIRNNNLLQKMIEKVAKNTFQKSKDPMDPAIFYLAMGKQKLLAKLFKNCNKTALFNFFNLDFSLDENKNRALNQAYKMRSKRRFDHAVALFLLCQAINDAILICLHNLKDIQLALMISRLYDLNISRSTENLHFIIRNHVIESNDPYIRSMGYWMLEEYSNSLDSLLKEPKNNTNSSEKLVPDTLFNSSDAIVFVFFNFLKRHPIILRQKLVLNKNTDQKPNDTITPMERRLYFRTAYTYLRMGCPDLALEVLSKLPERMTIQIDESINNSKITANFNENAKIFDFTFNNEPIDESISFQIEWDDNESTESKNENNNGYPDSFSNSVMDVMCLQYKFMICLKLISEELCTLATGIESHGSYLRYHLYSWLEKEVQVLRNLCSCSSNYENNVKLLFDENSKFSIKERVLLRKQWLKTNQSLIINLYSFCSLHGPNIVGLAAIRMELLILIQELQGNNCIHFDSGLDSHSSVNLPFVNSSISPDSGLIITPIQQLNTFILEIVDCIHSFKCPFSFIYNHSFHCNNKSEKETNENKSKIKLLRNQCQSLSACLHQCLSNFTGIKNNENFNHDKQRRPRQSSTSVIYSADSDIQLRSKYLSELDNNQKHIPNSDPIKWPGHVNLFKIIGSKTNSNITNFSHMLAEALVAVYTGILIYALHLNDSNLLYRLITIDFNKNLWGKIFGGTFRQKPERPSGPPTGSPGSNRESSKVKKESGNQIIQVSPSMPRNRLYSRLSPPINIKTQLLDERFIPPLCPILTCLLEKPAINSKSIEFIYDSDMDELDENLDSFTENEDLYSDKECTNNKSYTWALLRWIILHSVYFEIKELLKILQIENGELAIFCPNIYAIVNSISEWQNQCKIHLNNYSSIPKSYLEFFKDCQQSSKNDHVSTRLINLCKSFGNYENSPFKNRTNISLSMKRLWFSLIRKKKLQPIFVQHFLVSKHYQTEKDADQSDTLLNSYNSESNKNIRIIHKEHESLFSMAINQIDNSLLVTSTSKEIIELSVNNFADSENWYQHDYDYLLNTIKETEKNKNSEKCLTSDFLLISPTFGSTINLPSQDYSNSNVILKRPIHGIQIIKSHPLLPYYITGNTNGQVGVFEWSIDAAVVKTYSPIQKGKITSLNFDANGNKFGMGDSEGNFSLFHFSYADNSRAQYFQTRCPHKGVLDFCFINSSSLVATAGGSTLHGLSSVNQLHAVGSGNFDTNSVSISMWDVLLPSGRNQVRNLSDPQLAIGVVALCYVSRYELILAGTRKGEIALIDIRQNKIQNIFQAHDSCITAIKLDPLQYYFVSSAADGHIKIWQLHNQELFETFRSEPIKSSVFSKGDLCVKSLDIIGDNKIINCSADGFIKLRHVDLKSLCTNLNNVI